jgi:hypothetical protein
MKIYITVDVHVDIYRREGRSYFISANQAK